MDTTLDLWDFRRRVWDLYRDVRMTPDPRRGWERWCHGRDELFRTHAQSPVPADRRSDFPGLPVFPYDIRWRLEAIVRPVDGGVEDVAHSGAGVTGARVIGTVSMATPAGPAELSLFWLSGYAGGLFLPFRDATNGDTTYGGGRYLLDTAKGADLGHSGHRIVLDFNFAYHPSCVHDDRWSCPLAPPGNRIPGRVEAGERLAPDAGGTASVAWEA